MRRFFPFATRRQLCRDLTHQKESRDRLIDNIDRLTDEIGPLKAIVRELQKETRRLATSCMNWKEQRDTAMEDRDGMRQQRDNAIEKLGAAEETIAHRRVLLYRERAALREQLGLIIRQYIGDNPPPPSAKHVWSNNPMQVNPEPGKDCERP